MRRPLVHGPSALAWEAAAAVLYLTVALGAHPGSAGVLLYDGAVPLPPYRWAHPPAGSARGNQPPEPGAGSIRLYAAAASGAITTDDAQAAVIFTEGTIALRDGEQLVQVTLTPLDPGTLPPPPAALRIDGNAYRIEAVYARSHAPAVLRKSATVVLRFPTTGTQIAQAAGSGWTLLCSSVIPPAFQVVADTDTLGVFAAVAPRRTGFPWSLWLYRGVIGLIWLSAAALLAGLIRDYLRDRSGRRSRAAT